MVDGCTPKCRYHNETGRIEEDEIKEEYNKLVESYRQKNSIIDLPSESELFKLAKISFFLDQNNRCRCRSMLGY
jgi:N-dimethylarginine dimethylaminohydrolase